MENEKKNIAHKIIVIEKLLVLVSEMERDIEKHFNNIVATEIGVRLDEIYEILLREKAEILKNLWREQKSNSKKKEE